MLTAGTCVVGGAPPPLTSVPGGASGGGTWLQQACRPHPSTCLSCRLPAGPSFPCTPCLSPYSAMSASVSLASPPHSSASRAVGMLSVRPASRKVMATAGRAAWPSASAARVHTFTLTVSIPDSLCKKDRPDHFCLLIECY